MKLVIDSFASLPWNGRIFGFLKAFEVLNKYDPSVEHADAKRGACVGLFQMVLAGREHK